MDRNTLQERRKHFLAFVTALVMVFTMLCTSVVTAEHMEDVSGSGSDEPACEHKNTILRPYEGQEATCVEGCQGYKCCNDCEQIIVEVVEIPIDPNNHVGSKVPAGNAKDATCVAEGYTGDILCDACNKVWEKGSKIPINLNNHVGSKVSAGNAKDANCVEKGYTGDILCDECNNVWEKGEEIPIDKTKHAGPIVDAGNAKEASCTEEGYTGDKKCQACGTVTETGKKIDKEPHDWDEGTITTAATCIAKGVITYKCKNCGAEKPEKGEAPIDKTNHVHTAVVGQKEATCTAEGYTGDTKCSDCGTVIEQGKAIAKKAHEMDDGTVTKEATCSATGVRTYKCKNCEYTETEEIPIDKTNHVGPIVDAGNAKEASCTEEGYTGDKKCQACGTVTEQGKAIAKKAHELDDGTVTKEATCSATGVRTYKCKNCEYTETEEIPINKDAHDWDDGVVTKEPTCSATGEKLYTCKLNSSHTKTEVIPADKSKHTAGETKKENIKLPTCTVKGSHEENVYCKYCNVAMFVKSVIDEALGHKLVHHPAKDATADVEGNKEYWECTVCGKIFIDQDGKTETSLQEVTIPKLSEDPEEKREDATGKVGNVYTVGDCTYTITDMENLTVSLTGWNGKGTAFAVPDTVTIGGAKFTVTGIGAGAFAGNGKYYLTIINPTQALTTDPTTLGLVISRIQKEENVVISQVAVNTSDNTDGSSNDGDQSDSTGNVSASENAIDRILKGMNSNSKQNVFELDYIKQSNLTCDDFVKLCKTRSDAEKNCLLTCDGKLYVLHIPANIDTESDDFKTCLETFRANPYNGVAGPLTIATIFKSFGIICTQLEEIAINDASEKSLEEAKFIASKVAQSQDDKRYDLINQKKDLIVNLKNDIINQKNDLINQYNDLINQKNGLIKQKNDLINQKNNLTKQLENTQKSLNETLKARDKYQEKYKNATNAPKSTKSEASSRAQVLSRNNAIGDGKGGYIAQGGHVQINGGKSNVTFTLAAPTSGVLSSANKYANSVGGSLLHCVTTSSPGVSFKTATVNFTVTGVYANETIAVYQLQGKNWVQVLVSSVTDNHVVVNLTQHGPLAFVRVAPVATGTH